VRRAVFALILAIAASQLSPAAGRADDGPPKPTPTPKPASVVQSFTPEQYAQAQAIAQATSLSVRIEAERKLAAVERTFVAQRLAELRAERERVLARIADLRFEAVQRQQELDRVVQRQYRESRRSPLEVLLASGSILSALQASNALGTLADAQHDALIELQRVQAELETQQAELAAREADLATLGDSLAAKDALLAKLSAQAARLAEGGSAAEVAILRELVDTELAATVKVDQLVAAAAAAAGAPAFTRALAWLWPVKGVVSQGFGPSALTVEPPRTYHGVPYANFHDGIDIAAPLGSPVLAAASGTVAFVGHLPDGAEVVLIAHDGGLFTLYAHLDDTVAPPVVKMGQTVQAGDAIGWIGLTGITTGPHLHFVIRRGDEPVDPSALLPRS
jgi:murein DD-endopeptidase MepM/ murein hydrolase activator NlpD